MTVLLTAISLLFGVTTFCHQDQAEWMQVKAANGLPAHTTAFYRTRDSAIHLGPMTCGRLASPYGAQIMAHELAHDWQRRQGKPYDEAEAERIKWRTWRSVYRKICRVRSC